eukprot:CAMPEP_0196655450 /NCGR_PEP_ID=MMETSP1086-20130531/5191_1 /TAXON_ID=77921 /ORGANISM="Cyanoptyche  gloeocystis , Strain SAG4.97" /LENGTH=439 /DNA_ID=CAMNT_0041987761 /DNA_START=42 /DNA_END=1361 /DNA_ORIENTATION=+
MDASFVLNATAGPLARSVPSAQANACSKTSYSAKVRKPFVGMRSFNVIDGVAVSVAGASQFKKQMRMIASRSSSTPSVSEISMVQAAPSKSKFDVQLPADEPITLTRYLLLEQKKGTIGYDLDILLNSVATACKTIASQVHRAGIMNLVGLAGATNVQGEEQKKLDVIANDCIKNSLRLTGRMGIIASEEEDEPVLVDEDFAGNYVAVFDPLDGSSNIDASISTGTIFGIYKQVKQCVFDDGSVSPMSEREASCMVDVLQPGSNLIAAGYCMYSSSTMMVLSLGDGVNGFTLDPLIGEFVLTHPNIRIPEKGSIYSFNEGNSDNWDKALQTYVKDLKNPASGKPYSLRYIGSMVGDIHRTLLYGGIFGYPADKKNPNGKLRLLYECAPMGFIMEQAGGLASTGTERILHVKPEKVHQRLPTFLGSKLDVELLESYYKKV